MFQAGDYDTTETVNIPFNTFSSDNPSASVTVTDLGAGDIEIHKDGSTTKRASDNGVTVSIDFDGGTGNHMVHINLADNSDVGYYAVGSRFQVRLEGITVDGATLNVWIGCFSIGCVLRPTTAGRTLDVNATGEAGLDLDNTSGTIDAAQLGADCITSAKIADDAISAEHLNTGCITADAFAADAIVAATLATGCLTADAFAADALVAATFATGCLTADAFAANALVAATFAADFYAKSGITLTGTASVGDTTIKITLNGGVATDNYYNGQLVVITGGTGVGQARTILKYLSAGNAATPTRDFTVAPDNTSTFVVLGADVPSILEAGTATAGAASTITLDATASTSVDIYKNNFIMISGGTGAGQTRLIGAYSAGRVATVLPNWTTTPDATSIYQVLPAARVDIQGWAGNVVTGDGDWVAMKADTADVLAIVNHADYGNAKLVRSTTPANALDVTAGGCAGMDWGNVESPSSSVALVNTAISAVGGAVGSVSGAVGSVTGNVGGNVVGTVASVVGAVTTDAASRTASKADVSGLATLVALADGTVQVGTVQDGAIGAAAVADIFGTTAMTQSYPADGAAMTPAQALYLLTQRLNEFAITDNGDGTSTLTVKKLDGSTTAFTLTLNGDADTDPTSSTRAT